MGIEISELVYDRKLGYDVARKHELDFDGHAHKTAEEAAKALRQALIKYAIEVQGFTPDLAESEISLFDPERTTQYSGSKEWCVVWESGPYSWATGMFISGPWGHCEPYYSFDLHFCEG